MTNFDKTHSEPGFDITEYCNAAVVAMKEYCVQEFKKACGKAGIEWREEWEDVFYA